VTEELERSFELRCDRDAPAAVRDEVRKLGRLGVAPTDAMLVASELVTNAVRHSGAREEDRLAIRMRLGQDRLLISVTDPGTSGGAARAQSPQDPSAGIGLRLVEQLSQRWGSDRGDGHRVWAELAVGS
jgi:anti-sigma regulatory factor (Ser/Thr protein kinase)